MRLLHFFADLPPEAANDERILHIPGTLSLGFKPHQAADIDQQILEVRRTRKNVQINQPNSLLALFQSNLFFYRVLKFQV